MVTARFDVVSAKHSLAVSIMHGIVQSVHVLLFAVKLLAGVCVSALFAFVQQ